MADVFISKHDKSSMKWSEAIAAELESRGITVWYSPRNVESDYPKEIVEAINSCRVFLFLFDSFSNLSEHCLNEINIAFNRYSRHELISLLSFKISNDKPSANIIYYLGRIHAMDGTVPPEVIRIHELCDRIEYLLKKTNTYVELKKNKSKNSQPSSAGACAIVSGCIYPNRIFVGRANDLQNIHYILQSPVNKLFIVGTGGIGKSEIARKYAFDFRSSYQNEVWMQFHDSIASTIADDTCLKIEGLSRQDYIQETDNQYYARKIRILKQISDNKTLLIIDDFNVINDKDLDDFIQGPYTVLFTTRIHHLSDYIDDYDLTSLDAGKEQMDLFMDIYQRRLSNENVQTVRNLLKLIDGHTLLIRLIAGLMQKNRLSPDDMLAKMRSGEWLKLKDISRKNVASTLSAVARTANLSDDQKKILLNLSLIPNEGIDTSVFVARCDIQGFDDIDDLIRESWIISDPIEDRIHLHPLIKDLFRNMLADDISPVMNLIRSSVEKCRYTNNLPWDEKIELFKLMKSIDELLMSANDMNTSVSLQIRYRYAGMCMDMARYSEAASIYRDLLKDVRDPETRARLWYKMSQAYSFDKDMNNALLSANEGIAELKKQDSSQLSEDIKSYYIRGLLERLSEVSRNNKDYESGIAYAKQAVKLQQAIKKNRFRSYAWSLYHLACSYLARGNEQDIIDAKQAIVLSKEEFNQVNDDGGIIYCNEIEGNILIAEKNYAQALLIYQDVLEDMRKRFGDQHSDTRRIYMDIAICYKMMGDSKKENYYLKKAGYETVKIDAN